MKKILFILSIPLLFLSCRKVAAPLEGSAETVRSILAKQLTPADLTAVDYSTLQQAALSNGHTLYRVAMGKENVVLETNQSGSCLKSAIYQINGVVTKINGHAKFSGNFRRSDLSRTNAVHWAIDQGVVKELHVSNSHVANSLGQKPAFQCADCTLDEVVVSTSYRSGGIDWFTWMNLLSMFDMGSPMDYLAVDMPGGGGGGGSAPSAPVITIDPNDPQNKDKIDPKKFTDCFGTIPDGSTTVYSVTISADLPVDGHPETFFDWNTQNPGHAFIELNKSTPYGSVSQDMGFYPNTSFKVLTNDNIASKTVNDGGHEYQARYTITVTAGQFQTAINKLNQTSGNDYNISHYNCTDFALDVFNAAGGSLTIPRHAIPGFEIDGGSNTPQGLYEQINQLKNNGTAGTTTTHNKEYAGQSKGPCN